MIIHRTGARATALRFSLLASLGLLPVACGGAFQGADDGEGGDSGSGGSSSKAGSTSKGGTSSKGGSTSKAGSTSSGGTTSSAGSGTGGVSHPGPDCTAPVFDPNTGFVTCMEGYSHRPQPRACGINAATGADAAPAQGGGSGIGAPVPVLPRADGSVPCGPDDAAKCSMYQYGYCDGVFLGGEAPAPTCKSGCVIDQECGANMICVCGHPESPTGGVCRPSQCTSDLDCPYGYCASYSEVCGEGGYACHSPDDECQSSADCLGGSCSYDSVLGHRACNNAVCGRPFLVEAAPRLAPAVASGEWTSPAPGMPRVDHLTPAERGALADHWTKLGQMEHASIAAFARFNLQLLSLGAPPELVEACTRALADETAHTRLCFQLASAYAGCALGPGRLDVSGSLEVTSLEDIIDLVLAEGCFGETGAALDALESADSAADPVIRAAYTQIAQDEQRHAELAFQFVRWALELDPSITRARLQAALQSDLAQQSPARSVTVPCLEALLGATPVIPAETTHAEIQA